MLVAEELVLLGTDERGRSLLGAGFLKHLVVGGALLAELEQRERVAVDGRSRLHVVDSRSTGDELLDAAFDRFARGEGRRAKNTLLSVGRRAAGPLHDRLARLELVGRARGALGLGTRWPVLPGGPRDELLAEVAAVVTGRDPDTRTGPLVGLLEAAGALTRVVDEDLRPGMTDREVRRRGAEVAEGRAAVRAVVRAIRDARAAAAG